MSEIFTWLCLVYDDTPSTQPGIPATINWLKNNGFSAHLITKTDEFIDSADLIQQADLILCDLKFINFGGAHSQQAEIPTDSGIDIKKTVKEWIKAICAWNTPEDTSEWFPNRGHPSRRIPEGHVGFWLGAMTSHVNAQAEIIFYTSAPEIINAAIEAIGLFRGGQFSVVTKDPFELVSDVAIWEALTRRQIRLLANVPMVYQWFLRKVYMPILLDGSPLDGVAVQLSSSDPSRSYILKPNSFFPQLERCNAKASLLSRFLRTGQWTLPEWQRQALHALEHDLRAEVLAGYEARPIRDQLQFLDGLSGVALDAGTAGQQAFVPIDMALELLRGSSSWTTVKKLLGRAREACLCASRNSERDLEIVCAQFTSNSCREFGHVIVEGGATIRPDSYVGVADPPLPFPIASLRRVASALRHNWESYRVKSDTAAQILA
jgi:hypothetical protein